VNSLNMVGSESEIRAWIGVMLSSRTITAKLDGFTLMRYVRRGTPQGGSVSPLLWLFNMNELLEEINIAGVKAVANADDVVLRIGS